MLRLDNISKRYLNANGEPIQAGERRSRWRSNGGRVRLPGGPLRLRQDHHPAPHRGPGKGQPGAAFTWEANRWRGRRLSACVVFQRYTLFPWRSVLANVAFGLEIQGMPKARREERAMRYLSLVGLADQAGAHPTELSGGMQQRVAVGPGPGQ